MLPISVLLQKQEESAVRWLFYQDRMAFNKRTEKNDTVFPLPPTDFSKSLDKRCSASVHRGVVTRSPWGVAKQIKRRKIWLICSECDGQKVHPVTFQICSKWAFPFANIFYGPLTRWIQEINPTDLGNIPSGLIGYPPNKTHSETPLCLFTSILAVLEGPGQEGLTSDNLSSPSASDVSKKPLRKDRATLLC